MWFDDVGGYFATDCKKLKASDLDYIFNHVNFDFYILDVFTNVFDRNISIKYQRIYKRH